MTIIPTSPRKIKVKRRNNRNMNEENKRLNDLLSNYLELFSNLSSEASVENYAYLLKRMEDMAQEQKSGEITTAEYIALLGIANLLRIEMREALPKGLIA